MIPFESGTVDFLFSDFNIKNDIGYLPEQRGLFEKSKVGDQLESLGYLKGLEKRESQKSIDEWLSFFDILDFKNKKLHSLSKGNQQKVQFISSVLHNPDFLVLDEPFSGLDPINKDVFLKAIKSQKTKGKTVIYSSHQLESVEELSDKILFLKSGKVVHFDTIENIKNQYNYVLRIKNKSLTSELLEKEDINFCVKDNIFEINLDNPEEADNIVSLLPEKRSEIYSLQKMSLESIFKNINQEENKNEK